MSILRVSGFCLALFFAAVGQCSSIKFQANTPCGNCAGLPENLYVTITTGSGFISVGIDDETSNPTADTQGVSGIQFVIDFATSNVPTLPTPTGNLIKISSTTTAAAADTTDVINHWLVQNGGKTTTTTTINLDAFTGGSPNDLVIGPAPGGIYSNANNSLTNTGHNPYILQNGTFTINLAGVTTTTKVLSATFNVGTAQGFCLGGTVDQCLAGTVVVPEPATMWHMASVLPLLFVFLWRRQRGALRLR